MKKHTLAYPSGIRINIKAILFAYLLFTALLVLSSLIAHVAYEMYPHIILEKIRNQLDLDGERNIPALYSFLNLQLSALLLGFIYFSSQGRPYRRYWLWMSLIFMYLMVDELMSIHEKLSLLLAEVADISGSNSYYVWVIPFAILVLAFVVYFFPFLRSLTARFSRLFVLSGALYVGGALLMEVVGALHQAYYGYDFVHILIYSLEESLEMLGIILFIYALLRYYKEEIGDYALQIYFATEPAEHQEVEKAHLSQEVSG